MTHVTDHLITVKRKEGGGWPGDRVRHQSEPGYSSLPDSASPMASTIGVRTPDPTGRLLSERSLVSAPSLTQASPALRKSSDKSGRTSTKMKRTAKEIRAVLIALYHRPVKFGVWLIGFVLFVMSVIVFSLQLGRLLEERQQASIRDQKNQVYASQLFDYNQCLSRVESRHVIRSLFTDIANLPEIPSGPRDSFLANMDAQYPELTTEQCTAPIPPN